MPADSFSMRKATWSACRESATAPRPEARVWSWKSRPWLNAGYLDTEWKDFAGAVTGFGEVDLTGKPLPKAPELTLSANAEYTVQFGSNWEGFLRAEFNHEDKLFYDVNGTAGTIILGTRFPFEIPAHDVWNFRVGASNERYRIVAYIENAFDDDYYTSTYDFGFTNGAGVVPSFRTFGVRFTANFGQH